MLTPLFIKIGKFNSNELIPYYLERCRGPPTHQGYFCLDHRLYWEWTKPGPEPRKLKLEKVEWRQSRIRGVFNTQKNYL